VKEYFNTQLGIPHQNIKMEKFFTKSGQDKGFASKISKLILQMNVKAGGALWTVKRPEQVPQDTMIIGIDVYHKTILNRKSVMGFVASLDSDITKFYSTVKI
jgi:aubergine-like protein